MSSDSDSPNLLLCRACVEGDLDAVKNLLALPTCDPNALTPWNSAWTTTPFFDFGTNLVEKGVVEEEEYDAIALHLAVLAGQDDIVGLLVDHGADVNELDSRGRSALVCAIFGIDMLRATESNFTYLSSEHESHQSILKVHLLPHPRLSYQVLHEPQESILGLNLLCLAAYLDKKKMAELLLDVGRVKIDAKDANEATALMYAARDGHLEIVELLLERGASPLILDRNGFSVFQHGQDYPEVIALCEAVFHKDDDDDDDDGEEVHKQESTEASKKSLDHSSNPPNERLNRRLSRSRERLKANEDMSMMTSKSTNASKKRATSPSSPATNVLIMQRERPRERKSLPNKVESQETVGKFDEAQPSKKNQLRRSPSLPINENFIANASFSTESSKSIQSKDLSDKTLPSSDDTSLMNHKELEVELNGFRGKVVKTPWSDESVESHRMSFASSDSDGGSVLARELQLDILKSNYREIEVDYQFVHQRLNAISQEVKDAREFYRVLSINPQADSSEKAAAEAKWQSQLKRQMKYQKEMERLTKDKKRALDEIKESFNELRKRHPVRPLEWLLEELSEIEKNTRLPQISRGRDSVLSLDSMISSGSASMDAVFTADSSKDSHFKAMEKAMEQMKNESQSRIEKLEEELRESNIMQEKLFTELTALDGIVTELRQELDRMRNSRKRWKDLQQKALETQTIALFRAKEVSRAWQLELPNGRRLRVGVQENLEEEEEEEAQLREQSQDEDDEDEEEDEEVLSQRYAKMELAHRTLMKELDKAYWHRDFISDHIEVFSRELIIQQERNEKLVHIVLEQVREKLMRVDGMPDSSDVALDAGTLIGSSGRWASTSPISRHSRMCSTEHGPRETSSSISRHFRASSGSSTSSSQKKIRANSAVKIIEQQYNKQTNNYGNNSNVSIDIDAELVGGGGGGGGSEIAESLSNRDNQSSESIILNSTTNPNWSLQHLSLNSLTTTNGISGGSITAISPRKSNRNLEDLPEPDFISENSSEQISEVSLLSPTNGPISSTPLLDNHPKKVPSSEDSSLWGSMIGSTYSSSNKKQVLQKNDLYPKRQSVDSNLPLNSLSARKSPVFSRNMDRNEISNRLIPTRPIRPQSETAISNGEKSTSAVDSTDILIANVDSNSFTFSSTQPPQQKTLSRKLSNSSILSAAQARRTTNPKISDELNQLKKVKAEVAVLERSVVQQMKNTRSTNKEVAISDDFNREEEAKEPNTRKEAINKQKQVLAKKREEYLQRMANLQQLVYEDVK